MERLWIRGGQVYDPASGWEGPGELLVEDGRIAALEASLSGVDAEVLEADGLWVVPGMVDLHTHLRVPGQEYKEDIGSGGRSAAAGGFTSIACMANTSPVNDDPAVTDYILDRARVESPVRVYPVAAATQGQRGEVMTEMDALAKAGAVAFSDDGQTIMDSGVMRRVLQYSTLVGKAVITHAEDRTLVAGGVVNEGPVSTKLGLPGNPAIAEVIHVVRDLLLAEITGAHLHVAHVSTAGAVEHIRAARERGVHVTAEVTPHHLALTDEAALGYDTNCKMAPPLRSEADRRACVEGLADGTLDAIATDHAPHAPHEKDVEFTSAPPGILGFETAVPITLDLVRDGTLQPLEWVRCACEKPARILGLDAGTLRVGAPADVIAIDPERRWTYEASKGLSKSRNSPWDGASMLGRVIHTVVGGKPVYEAGRGVLAP